MIKELDLPNPIIKRYPVEGREFSHIFSMFYYRMEGDKKVKYELFTEHLREDERYTHLEFTKVSLFGRREVVLRRKGFSYNFGTKITNAAYNVEHAFDLLKTWLLDKELIAVEDIDE